MQDTHVALPVRIDEDFHALVPPLMEEESRQLEENLLRDGCREPLVIWLEEGLLLDGHNRYSLCSKYGIDYEVVPLSLPDREAARIWILENQFGRRNLTPFQRAELALKLKPAIANRAKENERARKGNQHGTSSQNSVNLSKSIDTHKELASKAGVSHDTISRAEFITVNADEQTKEKLRRGDATINSEYRRLKKEANQRERQQQKAEIIEIPDDEWAQFFVSDIADAHRHVEDTSVDFIITDPPYPKQYLEVYSELGKFAAHALRRGGSLLCMVGQSYLPDVLNRLSEYLQYNWTLAYLTPGGQSAQLFNRNVNTFWKPVLWLTRGKYKGDWVGDVTQSPANNNDKEHHHWGQSFYGMKDLMKRFVYPGQVICDPFLGGGTTGAVAVELGCQIIGLDSDPECIETSRPRILEFLSNKEK